MTTVLIEQIVTFTQVGSPIDVNTLLADSRIQGWLTNSQGRNPISLSSPSIVKQSSGKFMLQYTLQLDLLIPESFQTTLLADMNTLSATFPNMTSTTQAIGAYLA